MKSEVFLRWLENIYLPEAKLYVPGYDGPFVLIVDGHASHTIFEVINFCDNNNRIVLICLAAHTTHLCQPCDKALFGPMKKMWSRIIEFQRREKKVLRLDPLSLRYIILEFFLEH
jgi:hypothetical protein